MQFKSDKDQIKYLKEELERYKILSFKDILTGLYNRTYFEEELKRINNDRNYPLGIIIIDINRLKLVNDTLGHAGGDQIIKAMANGIKNCIRQDDMLARIGGDEFIILLKNVTSIIMEDIIKRLKQICIIKLSQPFHLKTTCSIGYIIVKEKTNKLEEWVNIADKRMYKNKMQSRKRKDEQEN